MSEQLPTPTPATTLETETFWEAAAEGRFILPRCNECDEVIWYPRLFCPACGSNDVGWFEASGQGTVYSFTVVERGQGGWKDHSPYVLAYVELAEGPRMLTNVIDIDPDDVAVDMAVSVRFDPGKDGGNLVRFGPAS